MADYLLAEEKDLVYLPDALSYTDGAQVACGFGTAYEGLEKIGISGDDIVFITGLGPVGLATAALYRKLGAQRIFGIDLLPGRLQLARDLMHDQKTIYGSWVTSTWRMEELVE